MYSVKAQLHFHGSGAFHFLVGLEHPGTALLSIFEWAG
jgi:hypothetical protein